MRFAFREGPKTGKTYAFTENGLPLGRMITYRKAGIEYSEIGDSNGPYGRITTYWVEFGHKNRLNDRVRVHTFYDVFTPYTTKRRHELVIDYEAGRIYYAINGREVKLPKHWNPLDVFERVYGAPFRKFDQYLRRAA